MNKVDNIKVCLISSIIGILPNINIICIFVYLSKFMDGNKSSITHQGQCHLSCVSFSKELPKVMLISTELNLILNIEILNKYHFFLYGKIMLMF